MFTAESGKMLPGVKHSEPVGTKKNGRIYEGKWWERMGYKIYDF